MQSNSIGFRHWEHNGKAIVAIPPKVLTQGVGRVDIRRLTNDPRELAAVIEYRLCEMMAMSGFSYKAIMKTLGLTSGEVSYRIKRVGVKVKEYRDGNSPLAKQVIGRLDEVAQQRLVENLEKFLLK